MIRAFRSLPQDLREWTVWIRDIETQGNFTATLTGYASNPTGEIEWIRIGRKIRLHAPSAITGTSNATSMTMTGLPDQITPENTKQQLVAVTDSGGQEVGLASISSTTITFSMGSPLSATGFTASSTKGLAAGWMLEWVLD